MPVIRREFEDGIRGFSSSRSSASDDSNSSKSSSGKMADYVSRPSGSGKRVSTLTLRLGDSGRSLGSQLAQSLRTSLARSSGAYRADSAISGSRVGTNNLTGAPLANESGSATLHQGLATGSNVTQIRVPAPKADLPGVPAILTRGSPLLGNRQVLMNFLKGSAFGGSAAQGSSINTNSVPLEDNCNPGYTNVKFEQEDEPPEPPAPPEDQGGSPLDPGEPPPPPVNFNCTPTGCVPSESGFYDTLPECEAQCQQRYTCRNGDCIPDPSGTHANLSLCLNACQSRYTCVDGTCVAFPTGGFATLLECTESCGLPRWDCVSGECTRTDSDGEFASAQECLDSGCNCTPTLWDVVIEAVWEHADPTIGGCLPAGNPVVCTNPLTVYSKSPPTFVQVHVPETAISSLGVNVDCHPFGYTQVFNCSGFTGLYCKMTVLSVSITPHTP